MKCKLQVQSYIGIFVGLYLETEEQGLKAPVQTKGS